MVKPAVREGSVVIEGRARSDAYVKDEIVGVRRGIDRYADERNTASAEM